LADHTTLRVGGPADHFTVARSEAELIEAVQAAAAASDPLFVLGGGSNVLVADDGWAGSVVRVACRGLSAVVSSSAGACVTAQAGEPWDDFVAWTLDQGWVGLEALSGIPGTVGAAPVQNIGAYGAEVADVVARVRAFDRASGQVETFAAQDAAFGYRTSRFKRAPGRHVILSVDFQLQPGSLSAPIRYAELARHVGVEIGQRARLAEVRQAVLALRRTKGMVLDPADHDTWSAGSFFTNPILPAAAVAALPEAAPRYPQADGTVKTSAAWLIERAGFPKGYGQGPARLSSRHVLAVTNTGGATAADLIALAAEVRTGVWRSFGVVLEPEPQLVACALPPLPAEAASL
jgi:UDP-N-acetylmuramate dehydrogenase